VLKPGRRAREQQQRHRRDLLDAVAALRGVPVRFPRPWPGLLAAMTAHASGDPAASSRVRGAAEGFPDAGVGDALRTFLTFSPQDAASVAGVLARL
jgi:hypothetical protein